MSDATSTSSRWYHFLAPSYWPTWLILGFMRILAWLPTSLGLAIGRGLGWLGYKLITKRRRVTLVNLRLCFPELSEDERERLALEAFKANGMGFVETAYAWWRSHSWAAKRVDAVGLEHLNTALEGGRGVILLSAHFSALDLSGPLILPFVQNSSVLYRPHNNALMEHFIFKGRSRFCRPVDRKDFRGVRRSLKENRCVWYAPDQDFGLKGAVFAPFFGQTAATLTITARMPGLNNSPMLMFSAYRENNGRYTLMFEPVEGFTGDEVADATLVNSVIERAIRRHPEQYMWMHKRFKTQPDGKQKLYKAAGC
ncbi:lipid A biosynthesis acyltransferase [Pokkaliibacter sp. CJK22405]|uniref:LpxL/LpxP family acyltransferase n=1 Tax=Pokkaliibacter sp. CJK22405 TaxID=3384615 RepID=UPI0039856382